MNKMFTKLALLSAISLAGLTAQAAFTYDGNGDLLLMFRSGTAVNDLIVDLGNVSSYRSATGPIDLTSKLTLDNITGTFGSMNSLTWSAEGHNNSTAIGDAPKQSLWATASSTTPWLAKSAAQQASPGNKIVAIGGLAAGVSGTTLSATAATVSKGDASSYTTLGNGGTFTYFPGSTEDTTPAAMANGTTDRLYLHEMKARSIGSGAGAEIGWIDFGLNQDGSLLATFTPVPEARDFGLVAAGALMLAFAFNSIRRQSFQNSI